jgi:PAS domain S-box-containing protein
MTTQSESQSGVRWLPVSSIVLAGYAVVGGAVSLTGWLANVPRLTDWFDNGISIQPNAAIAVMLAGAGLILLASGFRRAVAALGILVALIGATVLFQYLSGVNLGIDSLLMFGRNWGQGGVIAVGRMGPPGSTCWTLIGIGLVLATAHAGSTARRAVPPIALATLGIATLSITGYLYGADLLYSMPRLTVIALQTATFIAAVSLGLLGMVAEYGPTRLLRDPGPAGLIARRAVPAIILLPIILGMLRLAGERAGYYDLAFGTAARTLIEMALLLGLLWWSVLTVLRQQTARQAAQAALGSKERQLQHVTDNAAVLVAQMTRDLRFLFVNRTCAEFLGLPPEQIVGRPVADVMGAEAFETIRPHVEKVLSGHRVEFEAEIPYASAGRRWMRVVYVPDCDERGNVTGWIAAVTDISQRRRGDEAKARLAAIVESSDDAIVAKSLDGIITNWNAGAQRLFGYTAAEAIGQPVTMLMPPERFNEEPGILQRIRRGERIDHYETVRRRKDGTLLDVSLTVSPIVDPSGKIVGASKIARDITERKRAEQAIRESRKLLHITLSSIGDGVITTDVNGRVTFLNSVAEALTGWDKDAAEGQPLEAVFRIINEETRQPVENPALRALKEGVTVGLANHTVLLRKDGAERPIDDSAAPIQDEDGRVVGCVLIFRDVAERRQVEKRLYALMIALQEADRRKDEFLATLAHELRNPLAPLRNAVEIVKAKSPPDPELIWARDVIDRQVGQMARLLDDLMDVSRISRDKLELRKQRVELVSLIRSAVEDCRALADRFRHKLTVELPQVPIFLDADPARLAQIFGNLCNNACKYTPPEGQVCLSAERQGSDVVVTVRDTGIGIPTEKLLRVFDIFSQLDRGPEKTHGGLGIGLHLVKRLVEMHGGSVEARSGGEGRGSEFIVRLPVAIDTVKDGETKPGRAAAVPTAGLRILVVDDNRDSAESLSRLLGLSGHRVWVAHDGAEAVEKASAERPDAVLLDIGLPKLNGYDACREILREAGGRTPFMVALTGWGQDEDRRRSKEAGFDAHLVKPPDFDALVKLLETAAVRKTTESLG